jgi:serine/threonine protein kinase
MPTTVEAVVDEQGRVKLLQDVRYPSPRRAIVTILDEPSPFAPADDEAQTEPRVLPWTTKYEPIRQIGKGGMSVVHLARDRRTGGLVCVKELQDSARRSTLQQECRALARLRHPGILRLYNFEARGDHPYLVMEYGAGRPLSDHIRARHVAQEPVALTVAQRLFDAVATAHEDTVIHRDLKPDNVLVDERDGTLWPRVLDFGLAVVDQMDDRGAITAVGMPAGTFIYMAPEQIEARELTGACDVYALGLICWEMLSGSRAFSGSVPQIVSAKMSQDGLIVDRPLLGLTRDFADLIRACTRRRPEKRPTARAVSDALLALLPALPQQVNRAPTNLSFLSTDDERPSGWFDGLGYVHQTSMRYSRRTVTDAGSSQPCARLWRTAAPPGEFGVLMQRVPASHLAGFRVRLQASIRTERAGRAGLWVRADGAEPSIAFDNMEDRPIHGTTGWASYAVEVDMPESSRWFNFGALLVGDGVMLLRDVRLDVRDRTGLWIPLGLPEHHTAPPRAARTDDQLT